MQVHNGIRLLCAATMLGAIAVTPVAAAAFVKFTVPGAAGTSGVSINTYGDVAGGWTDSGNVNHGFLRTHTAGAITKFDPKGSTGTMITGINDNGLIVGYFTDSAGTHGFVRGTDAKITTYDAPGSNYASFGNSADANGINATNQTTGYFWNAQNMLTGFVRTP